MLGCRAPCTPRRPHWLTQSPAHSPLCLRRTMRRSWPPPTRSQRWRTPQARRPPRPRCEWALRQGCALQAARRRHTSYAYSSRQRALRETDGAPVLAAAGCKRAHPQLRARKRARARTPPCLRAEARAANSDAAARYLSLVRQLLGLGLSALQEAPQKVVLARSRLAQVRCKRWPPAHPAAAVRSPGACLLPAARVCGQAARCAPWGALVCQLTALRVSHAPRPTSWRCWRAPPRTPQPRLPSRSALRGLAVCVWLHRRHPTSR